MILTAFVAQSFDPKDQERIRPIMDFLNRFRKAGFLCETAEAAEVESVSQKVRKMIDEKDAFIGFFTRKHPVYKFTSARDVFYTALNKTPELWTAPAWVLQESGYAISAKKKLILLREEGVEIPGLQGDLEYIPFDHRNPAIVFSKLSDMIIDLLAKASGREIKQIMLEKHEQEQVQAAVEPAVPESKPEIPTDTEKTNLTMYLFQMLEAMDKADLEGLYEAYQAGTKLIAKGGTDTDQISWDCYYYESRFQAGVADGLEKLRAIRSENPKRPEPSNAIARRLYDAKEYEEAAQLFLEAAGLSPGAAMVDDLVDAAKAFKELRRYEEGKAAIYKALAVATGDARREAISVLYHLLKDSGKKYLAYATAEAAIHDNPKFSLRFTLALDYHRSDLNSLGLYHFKFLHEHDKNDSAALHNLALLYKDCELPICSVEHYKKAFEMKETLSAANLGFMYLDAGMTDEAKLLIGKAMDIEPHEARVDACFAEITQRTGEERKQETKLLDEANAERAFFVKMGLGLQTIISSVDGRWRFPFGEMVLTLTLDSINGTAEIEKKDPARLGRALFGMPKPSDSKEKKIDKYTIEGKLHGSLCEFDLTVEDLSDPYPGVRSILGGSPKREGYILFAANGQSGLYAEIADNKIGKQETITKLS